MTKGKRKTITVEDVNWNKYIQLKAQQLLELSENPQQEDELNFTEFANYSMRICNLTLADVREQRKVGYIDFNRVDIRGE